MSHQSPKNQRVVKALSGVAGVTLTVIVLITCAAKLRTQTSAPPAERSVVSSKTPAPTEIVRDVASDAVPTHDHAPAAPPEDARRITAADGFIPDDVTLSPFDVDQPAVGQLDPNLLAAIQRAASDAALDDVDVRINSGWRSARYQQKLLAAAIETYGNKREALKWVDTPEQSSHVAGKAVDIAPTAADDWLIRHGNRYGLCQIYANEIWHFELAVEPGARCPLPKADASDG